MILGEKIFLSEISAKIYEIFEKINFWILGYGFFARLHWDTITLALIDIFSKNNFFCGTKWGDLVWFKILFGLHHYKPQQTEPKSAKIAIWDRRIFLQKFLPKF